MVLKCKFNNVLGGGGRFSNFLQLPTLWLPNISVTWGTGHTCLGAGYIRPGTRLAGKLNVLKFYLLSISRRKFQHRSFLESFFPFWGCHLSRTRSISVSVQSWCSARGNIWSYNDFLNFLMKIFPKLDGNLWKHSVKTQSQVADLLDFPKIKFCLWSDTGAGGEAASWKMMEIYFSWQTLIIWHW